MAHQLASDIWPYLVSGPHADLAAGKLTLPLLAAQDADPTLASAWREGPLGPAAQQAVRSRVMASGAIMYAQMRVEVWKKEAHDLLVSLAVPDLLEEMTPLIEMASFTRRPGVGA
jgi:hypothetical protein